MVIAPGRDRRKNVRLAKVREKSAIICCHLSYLLMDDSGKKNNQKFPIDLPEKCAGFGRRDGITA